MFNIQEIMAILPHRYPFLLVDRIVELEEGVRIVGEKLVTINEPFFQGHFPGFPIMPGVLIIEALAQTGAVAVLNMPDYQGKRAYLAGIDHARIRHPVHPGDLLRLEVQLEKFKRGIGKASMKATVQEHIACDGQLLFAVGD